jgi:IS4 transposase
MIVNEVLQRFEQHSPLTVMARIGLEHALNAAWVNELFEAQRGTQYTRELLFSTTVEVMSLVALGLRPSVHAAVKQMPNLPVSYQALYEKIKKTEPQVIRALVQGSSERLLPLVEALTDKHSPTVPGYRTRIVDGNHLPASQKRLKVLRDFRGAALPGQSLVVYDPDRQLVVDVLTCEDAHTQERVLMKQILETATQGDLWLADRNFCTSAILCGFISKQANFLIREHAANPNPEVLSTLRCAGRVETGNVYEQWVGVEDEHGKLHKLRRIELHLDEHTEGGDRVIRLLSNVPKSRCTAPQLARTYRRRWKIENMFQRLESVLHSEVRTLGAPRAALLAFGVAVVAYNVLSLIQLAVQAQHADTLAEKKVELSTFYIAEQIREAYPGMLVAIPPAQWAGYESTSIKALVEKLLDLAVRIDPMRIRSHPRKPKVAKKKGYVPKRLAQQHVATSRFIADARAKA